MTKAVEQLLKSYESLSGVEKHDAATKLMRRALKSSSGAVPEDAFVLAAEELFLELDAREAANGNAY